MEVMYEGSAALNDGLLYCIFIPIDVRGGFYRHIPRKSAFTVFTTKAFTWPRGIAEARCQSDKYKGHRKVTPTAWK